MGWLLLIIAGVAVWGVTLAAYRRGRLHTPWHRDVAGLGLLALATLGFFWRVVAGQNWMPADGGISSPSSSPPIASPPRL